MSPEQALGRTIDKRSDIWAFGCVLFEMLTGREAFRGATIQDTVAAILTAPVIDAIDPDGTRVAYVMERDGVRQLYLRALDELEAEPIPKTEGASARSSAPDGQWVASRARD